MKILNKFHKEFTSLPTKMATVPHVLLVCSPKLGGYKQFTTSLQMKSNKQAFVPGIMPQTAPNFVKPAVNYKPKTAQIPERQGGSSGRIAGGSFNKAKPTEKKGRDRRVAFDISLSTNKYTNIAMNNKSNNNSSYNNNSGKDRYYGIDSRDGTAIKLNYPPVNTLYTNALDEGSRYSLNNAANNYSTQNNQVALNVIEFDPSGFSGSVADRNFSNIFDRLLNKLSVLSNATTIQKFTRQNFSLYIDKVVELVDLWYELDAFLAWSPQSDMYNEGLATIVGYLNTSDLTNAKYEARQFIKSLWLPTEIIKFIQWKNQTYRTSQLPNSSLMKMISATAFTSIDAKNPQAFINKLDKLQLDLSASADSPTQLSSVTRSVMGGIFKNYLNGTFMEDLPLSCNTSVYDVCYCDIFANQSVIYGLTNIYPKYSGTERQMVSFNDTNNISELTMAMQGYFVDTTTNATGLIREAATVQGTGVPSNRWIIDWDRNADVFNLLTRNNFYNHIGHDFHKADLVSASVTQLVSINPPGSQRVVVDGTTNTNIAVREVQNKLFGI